MVDAIKAMVSSPVDSGTMDEIKELIKSVLVTFTGYYVKGYTLGLVKKGIDDAAAAPPPEWKLLERPPRTATFKEGWVIKQSGFFKKKMGKRYFVVRPDYMIDYYVTEAEAKKEGGKKKGTISLCGYYVNDDANNGPLQRLTKLAEKMGVDLSGLPKPKEYPPNTMELYHNRRKSYYIQLEDPEEFKQWLEQMRTCAWRAYGFKNREEIHVHAFHQAIRETRYKLGRWGWWSYGGTEEQILSDLIADEIDWVVMGKIYSKIQGPWIVRDKIRTQVLKTIDKLVIAAVTPAWKGMSGTVEQVRPKVEPKINEMVGPIGAAKLQVINKIKEACMSVINPALKEHVIPHISKIVDVIQSPIGDAFMESQQLFTTEVIGKFNIKPSAQENQSEFSTMDWFPHSWKMYDVTRKVDVMYEPLWALNIIFKDIYPWGLIWTAHDVLKEKMDNAIYTFETRLIKDMEGGASADSGLVDKTRNAVLEDYKTDARQAITFYHTDILKKIIMPPFNAIVFPLAEALLSPLSDAIPEPMQEFLDINDMFRQVVEGVIDDSIKTVLEH